MSQFLAQVLHLGSRAPALRQIDNSRQYKHLILVMNGIQGDFDFNFRAILATSKELAAFAHFAILR